MKIGTVFLTGAMLMGLPSGAAAEAPQAPALAGDVWVNSAPLQPADLEGRVTLVEFWTFGCYNCRNVEPKIKAWHTAYAPQGLLVIGIHSPEFDHERGRKAVERYARSQQLAHPILLDDEFVNWRRFGNNAWPAIYLIDRGGRIRYRKIGEGDYDRTEAAIRQLLTEPAPPANQ